MAWDEFGYNLAQFFGPIGQGIAKSVMDSRTAEELRKINDIKTLEDFASVTTPTNIYDSEKLSKLEKFREGKKTQLEAQGAAPVQAEATRLNRIAANDPYVGSAEGLQDFADRPDFWLGQNNTGVIPGVKKSAGSSTMAGNNPRIAEVVQGFGNQNQNLLDAFRVTGNMPQARLMQNKDLTGNFKDITQGTENISKVQSSDQKTAEAADKLARQKATMDYYNDTPVTVDPADMERFRTGLRKVAGTEDVAKPFLDRFDKVNDPLQDTNEAQLTLRALNGDTKAREALDLMQGRKIETSLASRPPRAVNVFNQERGRNKDEQSLRKEFLGLPEVKEYPTVENQIQRGLAALKEPGRNKLAVDQTVITVLNKMLDPTSVVRESEYARTPQDMAALNRIKGKFEKLATGGAGLTNDDRIALIRMTQNFSSIASKQYNERVREYKALAESYGYSPDRVVPRKNALSEDGRPQNTPNIAPAGTQARLKDGRTVTSDGKGGWR